jgi:RND family efflux transporter MFP subunit
MSVTLANRPETSVNPPSVKHPAEAKPIAAARVARRPKPQRHSWLLIAAIVAIAGGAWYVYESQHASARPSTQTDKAPSASQEPASKATLGFLSDNTAKGSKNSPAARLATVPVEVVQHSKILRLTGSLIADERSSVASNASGIASEVRVDRGSIVRKNDIMVQIDPSDAKNKLIEGQALYAELKARLGIDGDLEGFNPLDQPEVRLAKASVDLAMSNLKRAKDLHEKKVVSSEAYDQTQTEFELATQRYRQSLLLIKQAYQACMTAQARLSILEKAVADTTIRAPFDGLVAERLVSVGEQISSGMQATKVVTLVRTDPLRLSLTVPQQNIGSIQPGQTVRFHVDSFPDRMFEGKVQFIAPVVTNDTRSMVVEAVVPNPDGALRPGLFATAELVLQNKAAEVFAPSSAVQRTGEVARVFVVRDGMAREQVVALGQENKGKIHITSGLTGKELLVARPDLIHDGDAVGP